MPYLSSFVTSEDVGKLSSTWRAKVGKVIADRSWEDAIPAPHKMCCQGFGIGRCRNNFSDTNLAVISNCKRRLWALNKIPKELFSFVQEVPLFQFCIPAPAPGSAGSSGDASPSFRLVLMPLCIMQPLQVFWDCNLRDGAVLGPGESVYVRPDISRALVTEADLSIWMLNAGGVAGRVLKVAYDFVGLMELRVREVVDITRKLQELVIGNALEDELVLLKKMAATKKKRKPGVKGKKAGLDASADADDDGGVADSDEEHVAGEIDDADFIEYDDALAEWTAAEAELAPPIPASELAADGPPVPPPVEEPRLPIVVEHSATHTFFFNPDNPTERWGRIALMPLRAGALRPEYSLYCNLHGCQRLRGAHRFPHRGHIRRWLQEGTDLPRGAGGRAAHLRAFDALPLP